jgi:uncharacterized membrane protein
VDRATPYIEDMEENTNPTPAVEQLPAATKENLQVLENFQDHEDEQVSGMQLAIERTSAFFGSPTYFICAVAFIILWGVVNLYGTHHGWQHVDEPPFFWLQGLVSSNALLLTVAVLIRQNRMSQVAEHRSHLDLQINLLTEQKVAKILQLVDELQRELIGHRRAADRQVENEVQEMTKPADAHVLMHAIKQKKDERDR